MPDDSVTGHPAKQCEAEDLAARVQAAIDTLPARQQAILRRRMDGESQSSIGDSLGISKERVRQLEMQSRRDLKWQLASLQEVA